MEPEGPTVLTGARVSVLFGLLNYFSTYAGNLVVALVETGSVSTFCGMEKTWIQRVKHKQLNIGDRTKWNLSLLYCDCTQFTHGYTDPVPYETKCIYKVVPVLN
jgi:hypothetical protein